jgi:guanosine-3',5'-bis(diphosphate) 3'-pyrophosphohydrolase
MPIMLTATQLTKKIRSYQPDADLDIVERAYRVAQRAHKDQLRNSGDPYFSHCVATARHLIEMQLDPITVAAGLLHDVPEDTEVTLEDLGHEFGEEVVFLVAGVTKLSRVRMEQRQVEELSRGQVDDRAEKELAAIENLRKMLLAMAQDIRVVLIKLADRMHNMETLAAVPTHKQRRIALETLEVYAPLAERLGMGEVKGKLQDLAFPFVNPEGYAWVKDLATPYYLETDRYLRRVMRQIEADLAAQKIEGSVHGRNKHLYSLYRKLRDNERDISKIYDLIAVRILVEDVPACYEVLGLLHQQWKPLLGRIKDYIALPKPSGYQSLHTTVFCLDGRIVEFQIRTHQMHQEAEYGIAAHWGYKERTQAMGKLSWVQQLAAWQQEVSSSSEFLEALKIDTFRHRIFVFTPKGDVKDLPAGATPLDFAYSIHSGVGDKTYGAKINGKLSALSTPLQNGDVVDILTQAKSQPKHAWLDIAVTSGARAHIRKALRDQQSKLEIEAEGLAKVEEVVLPPPQAKPLMIRDPEGEDRSGAISVQGAKGFLVRLALCCNPTPGDAIVGIVTVGKGISVHQRWCPNVQTIGEQGRSVAVAWDGESRKRAQLQIEAYDRNGLTRDIAAIVSASGLSIMGFSGETKEDQTVHYALTIEGNSDQELREVAVRLHHVPNVYFVGRA